MKSKQKNNHVLYMCQQKSKLTKQQTTRKILKAFTY